MKKIWFFVEGDSEENFIENLIRVKYSESILLENDLSAFVKKDLSDFTHHLSYCENCHSVDKIPHRINDLLHLIEKSQASKLIVVCDLESLPCFTERKNKINSIIKESINRDDILYAFFNPMIEVGFWECEEIIKRVIEIEHRNKFDRNTTTAIILDQNIEHPLAALKRSFMKYKVKYRESKFSEMFFPRVDFNTCQNNVLLRIVSYLDNI
jgi:hypothetical protein